MLNNFRANYESKFLISFYYSFLLEFFYCYLGPVYFNDAKDHLEDQISMAKIAMARLPSPQLYCVLSGNDFTFDINNPEESKIICIGNNPQKIQIYGAVLSLYVNRLIKLINNKGKLKSNFIFDEFLTIYLNNMNNLIARARSNRVSASLDVQNFSQLRKDYGRE